MIMDLETDPSLAVCVWRYYIVRGDDAKTPDKRRERDVIERMGTNSLLDRQRYEYMNQKNACMAEICKKQFAFLTGPRAGAY